MSNHEAMIFAPEWFEQSNSLDILVQQPRNVIKILQVTMVNERYYYPLVIIKFVIVKCHVGLR